MKKKYLVGTNISTWNSGNSQTVTFIITEDCNLRCKYCYITHKAANKKMNLDTAKKFIDFLLDEKIDKTDGVVIEFIGGEPFLETELMTQIVNYFKITAFEKDKSWYWNYRINISTNGVNYSDNDVQKFIIENLGKISVSITIDGIKEKHDLQRVFPDESGSYDIINKNIPLYIKQSGNSTKVTFASEDLIYLKESIISLWNKGIIDVAANVVFEDVWKDGDDIIFEEQLISLANYIIDNKVYDKYRCTLFLDFIGQFNDKKSLNQTFCGAGKMIALGPDGKIYPCIRYKDYSLNNKEEWSIGDVDSKIDMEKVRPFVTAMNYLQSSEECLKCEVATGCAFCQGYNYDEAETPTIFSRATFICKMHKARVRANEYYFSLLYNKFGIKRENYDLGKRKKMYILLSEDYVTYCENKNNNETNKIIDVDILKNALEFSRKEFFYPVLVHSKSGLDYYDLEEFEKYNILHIIPANFYNESKKVKDYIIVFDKTNYNINCDKIEKCILNVDSNDIMYLSKYIIKIFNKANYIEVNICDLKRNFDELEYKKQLIIIKDYLVKLYHEKNIMKKINIITELCYLKENDNCKAGEYSFALAPNEKIYVCSAFYSSNKNSYIGNLKDGIYQNKNSQLFNINYKPICSMCDAMQCNGCVYLNVNTTNEINIPPSFKCRKSHIERIVSKDYQLEMGGIGENKIKNISYLDPIELLIENKGIQKGYYIFNKE